VGIKKKFLSCFALCEYNLNKKKKIFIRGTQITGKVRKSDEKVLEAF